MILYLAKNNLDEKIAIIHFGIGLIGSSIKKIILNNIFFQEVVFFEFSIEWDQENSYKEKLNEFFLNNYDKLKESSNIYIIWSAGKAGFQSNDFEADKQFIQFKMMNNYLSENLKKTNVFTKFYLLSSAGGLFEGQVCVDKNSTPIPLRTYGKIKLKEEEFFEKNKLYSDIEILRVSSVYSIDALNKRKGIIQVLIENGIKGTETHIFGNESTLRDYVLDEDIANFIVSSIYLKKSNKKINYLVSGKPTSIFEIKKSIENLISKKLYTTYSTKKSNALNITFSSSIIAEGFTSNLSRNNLKKHFLKLNQKNGSIIL